MARRILLEVMGRVRYGEQHSALQNQVVQRQQPSSGKRNVRFRACMQSPLCLPDTYAGIVRISTCPPAPAPPPFISRIQKRHRSKHQHSGYCPPKAPTQLTIVLQTGEAAGTTPCFTSGEQMASDPPPTPGVYSNSCPLHQ